MLPPGWEIAAVVCKWLVYLATAMLAGSLLHGHFYDDGSRRQLEWRLGYAQAAGLLGFLASIIQFLAQLGQINARGLAGMLDWSMASFLLDTSSGSTTLGRMTGFIVVLLVGAVGLWKSRRLTCSPTQGLRRTLQGFLVVAMVMLLWTYRTSGHVSLLSLPFQLGLMLHVLVFAAWIGALPPFLMAMGGQSAAVIRRHMEAFGNQALVGVIVLALAGVLLVFGLLQSPMELVNSAYGRALLIKLLLVAVILAIAALNRYRLVPALTQARAVAALRRSLHWEVGVGLMILAVTAYLSTLVGPLGHQA